MSKSLFDQAKAENSKPKLNPVLNVGKKLLDLSARPSQAVLHTLQNQSGTGVMGLSPQHLAESFAAGGRALMDTSGKSDINLREATGVDKNAGGLGLGAIDFIGSTVLDPTMYIGVGELRAASKLGQVGLKAIAKESPELATKVAQVGFKGLEPAEQAAVRTTLMSSAAAGKASGDKALTAAYRSATGRTGRTGAEKFTSKLIGGADEIAPLGKLLEPQGAKVLGKTVLKKTTVDGLAKATGLTALSAATKASAVGRVAKGAKELVTPRARVASELGQEAADVIGDAASRSRSEVNNAISNISNAVTAAVKKANISDKELRMMTDALDKGKVPQLGAFFARKGRTDAAKLLTVLDKAKSQTDDALKAATQGPQTSLFDEAATQGLKRTPTRELKRLLQDSPDQVAAALNATPEATGNLVNNIGEAVGKYAPGKSIQELNKELGPKLGIEKLFEEDPIRAVLEHGKQVSRDMAFGHMLQDLAKSVDDKGRPLVIKAGDAKPPKGYQMVNSKVLGKFYAPPSIAKELSHTVTLLDNNESLHALSRVAQGWTQLWRTQATSSLLFGLGFQARNLFGNVFNMWEKGFDNPAFFADANKMRAAVQSGSKKGIPWQVAIRQSKMTPKQKRQLSWMVQDGIIGSSFLRTDLKQAGIAINKKQRLAQALDPRSSESLITLNKPGHQLAQFIEDNSRMAMWLSEFSKTGSREAATRTVKETLFDYADLTEAERQLKNWAVPFYTWQRKNLSLQLWALQNAPGKIAAVDRLRDEIAANGPDVSGMNIPGYAQDANQIPLFSLGNTPVLGTIQTPVEAAANFVQPVADLASLFAPGSANNPQGGQRAAAGIANLVGGGPGSLAKQGVSEAAGVNLFTGAPLQQGAKPTAERFAKALLPTYGRVTSVTNTASKSPEEQKAKAISQLTGLQLTPLTKDVQKSAALKSKAEGSKIRKKKSKKSKKKSLYNGG